MSVKLLFNPSHSFGGGFARMFDDYASMKECVTEYLRRSAKRATSVDFEDAWSSNRLPERLETMLKDTVPADHRKKFNHSTKFKVQTRYVGEPRIKIGDEKPLSVDKPNTGFGRYEISYWASLQLEVRAVYTTAEGEVKEAGKPYVPAHTEEHTTEVYKVYMLGNEYERKFSLTDGEPYYHCFTNGSVAMVSDEMML